MKSKLRRYFWLISFFTITAYAQDFARVEKIIRNCTNTIPIIKTHAQWFEQTGRLVLVTEHFDGMVELGAITFNLSAAPVHIRGSGLKFQCLDDEDCVDFQVAQRGTDGKIRVQYKRRQDSYVFLGCSMENLDRVQRLLRD